MFMVYIEFGDLFFEYFFENLSEDTVLKYISNCYQVFSEHYKNLTFSESQLKSTFANILQTQNTQATFSFRLKNNTVEEKWKLRIYNTKLCHFVGGFNVMNEKAYLGNTYSSIFPTLLLERNIADCIHIKKIYLAKKKWFLFGKLANTSVLEAQGKAVGIYLNRKFFMMKNLQDARYWGKYNFISDNFCELIKFIKTTLSNQNPQQIISIPFEKKAMQIFLETYDQQLLCIENKEQFTKLLASVNISLDDWLKA